jgi:hypothetical protein
MRPLSPRYGKSSVAARISYNGGALYTEQVSNQLQRDKQRKYVKQVEEVERKCSLDDTLSVMLGNSEVQGFAHAFWLWREGKVEFYTDIAMLK